MTKIILMAFAISASAATGKQQVEYKFVPNTERLVGIYRRDSLLIGQLDSEGEFHQTRRFDPLPILGSDELDVLKIIVYSGPAYERLNQGTETPMRVYEFRSGMLIPGTIRERGNFVPEEGGKIVSFKTYQYSKSAIPIWNLPGRYEIVVKPKK